MSDDKVHVLVVCGAAGTGKTSTMHEIGHELRSIGVSHALVDTDEIDRVWPQPEPIEALVSISRRNLQAVWTTFAEFGIRHLVLSGVMASIRQSEPWIRDAVGGASITCVRLTAERATRELRLRGRELGSAFEHNMHASDQASSFIHDHDPPGIPLVVTDGKSVAAVAEEVLRSVNWP